MLSEQVVSEDQRSVFRYQSKQSAWHLDEWRKLRDEGQEQESGEDSIKTCQTWVHQNKQRSFAI